MNDFRFTLFCLMLFGLVACNAQKQAFSATNLSKVDGLEQVIVDTLITNAEAIKDTSNSIIQQDSLQKNDNRTQAVEETIADKAFLLDTLANNLPAVDSKKISVMPPKINSLVSAEEQKLRIQIDKQERLLGSAWKKYYNIHALLERYVKLEATDRLLNINHYKTEATRLNNNQSGLQFIIRSKLPNTTPQLAGIDLLKIGESFVNALLRYSQVSSTDLKSTDAQISLTFYGNISTPLITKVETEMNKLGLTYTTQQHPANELIVHIALSSDNFFHKDLQKWERTEQRINRDIRVLEGRIVNLNRR